MKETQSAGGVVLNPQNQVLVVKQKGNSWSLPKGHLNENEEKLAAAKREIYEESGVDDLVLLQEIAQYQRYRIGADGEEDLSELKNITMFLFRTRQMDLCPLDVDNPEARWVDPQDVANLLSHPKDKEFFRSVMGNILKDLS